MCKYPKVNYIGNKEKITKWIINNLPLQNGTVLDLFCGGCSVSYALKQNHYNVISNDILYSNYVLAKAIVENDDVRLLESDLVLEQEDCKFSDDVLFLVNKLYFEDEIKELSSLVNKSNHLKDYKKYLFLALLRRAMIRKIPYSRMNIKWDEIVKLRNEEYSYKKYGRYRHYHNITFFEHIKDNLSEYNDAVFNNNTHCIAQNYDAYECLYRLEKPVDIIYMDPPYPSTMNKYNDFYGDFDRIFQKEISNGIDLTNKNTFLNNFAKLIRLCVGKTKYVAISLNNRSYPSADLLLSQISTFINEYKIFTTEHSYKVTGKENKKLNIEILLVCKMKENL